MTMDTESRRIIVEPSAELATEACAEVFRRIVAESAGENERCSLALAGGTTPHALYEHLARHYATSGTIPWGRLDVFFGDERDVPQDHVESNYHMAQRALLDHVPLPLSQVHPMPADAGDLASASEEYEQAIRRVVGVGDGEMPRFDLILLGMGGDGHTASLFPHTEILDEKKKLVAAHFVPVLGRSRMTFTYPLINAARNVILLVTGEDKGEAVEQLVHGEADRREIPAAGVAPTAGVLTLILDAAAAHRAGLRPE